MLIKVEFASFGFDPNRNTPLVILKEVSGTRLVPIPVGPLEAGSIAIKTLDVATEKPLTIDVAKCILKELSGTLLRVIIEQETRRGSLVAKLEIAAHGAIRRVTIRPCDAIALALRCSAPVFVRETVFDRAAGTGSGEQDSSDPQNASGSLRSLRTRISSLDTMEFGSFHLE